MIGRTLLLAGLTAAWFASAYRVWISIRLPATIWRTAFTVAILCATLGVTFQTFSPQIDAVTAPSVGTLLNHVITIVGLASVQIYVATLRRDQPPRQLLTRVIFAASLAQLITVLGWTNATVFHTTPVTPFAASLEDSWALTYYAPFWAYLGVTLVLVAKFCLVEERGAAGADRARAVSMTIIGAGAAAAVIYAAAAAAGAAYVRMTGDYTSGAFRISDLFIGVSVGLLGVGILALLVVPPVEALARNRRRLRMLRPLWVDLQRAVPTVRLTPPERDPGWRPLRSGGGGSSAQLERASIEIRDALEVVEIRQPGSKDITAVADRLRERLTPAPKRVNGLRTGDPLSPETTGQTVGQTARDPAREAATVTAPAATFLPLSSTLAQDQDQLYALATAYQRGRRHLMSAGRRSARALDPDRVPSPPA